MISFFIAAVTPFILISLSAVYGDLNRPRGVPISKASFYQAGPDFTCLDGSITIPFDRINDDFCDCPDNSDEPGTAACPNGSFHCTNSGHKPKNIPSSWVNDGICDCCDGTDEYGGIKACDNTCRELGRAAREAAEQYRLLVEEGYKHYLEYCARGQEARKQKQVRKEQVDAEKQEAELRKNELEVLKNAAEKPEKEAKDRHKSAWEAEQAKRKEEGEKEAAAEGFAELDSNSDMRVSAEELLSHIEFDIDSNGEVSLEEAKEYLEDNDWLEYDVFLEKVWPNIKEIYKKPSNEEASPTVPPSEEQEAPPSEEGEAAEEGEEEEDEDEDYPPEFPAKSGPRGDVDEDYGDIRDPGDDVVAEDDKGAGEEQMPDYDEDTKSLIAAADQARTEFEEAEKKFRDLEREANEVTQFLETDFGENHEFFPLKGECFEFSDMQYTYSLCPFDRASQRNKNGGADTSLGRWGHWSGSTDNKYSSMKYDRGQNCWNGPDRSVQVILSCGINNAVTGASEPNRCEYEFTFTTPAVCKNIPSPAPDTDGHDEL